MSFTLQGTLGGLFDGIGQAFSNTVGKVVEPIINALNDVIVVPLTTWIGFYFGQLLYALQLGFFYVIDAVQQVIRKIVGLPAYTLNGEETFNFVLNGQTYTSQDGNVADLVLTLVQDATVQSVFLSLLIAGIILLFITTFIAVLKTEFDKKDNSKGAVIRNAIKSVMYFALVPIVCFIGIIVSDLVLQMLDSATSHRSTALSTQIFVCAGYDGNRARQSTSKARDFYNDYFITNPYFSATSVMADINSTDPTARARAQDAIANAIDMAFKANSTSASKSVGSMSFSYSTGIGGGTVHTNSFDIKNYQLVYVFYDPFGYNYLIGFAGGFVMLNILLNLLVGVIRRMYNLIILFVCSPVVVATMPLDDGEKFKTWKGEFIKNVFSTYGPIIGINLVFMALSVVQGITFF